MFVVFIGPPGVGKGTQCRRLAERLGVPHLSTGEIFRQAIRQGTDLSEKAVAYIESGTLVPDELVVELVTRRLAHEDCDRGCVLDGFPRTISQADALEAYLLSRGRAVDMVIQLVVPPAELERRLCERAAGERRADDTPETIRRRFEVYSAATEPLVTYYRKRNLLQVVDGVGDPADVYGRVQQCVGQ